MSFVKISPFKIERFFSKYEFSLPYQLGSSDSESFSVAEMMALEDGAYEKFSNLRLGYTESRGGSELLSEISQLYHSASSSNLLAFAGAQEGIFCFMNSALRRGDEVVVQFPAYQSLFQVAASLGCRVRKWEMSDENGWSVDISQLKKLVGKKTRAIILNSPHNPTGSIIEKGEMEEIISIASRTGAYVFSDEVYRPYGFEGKRWADSACDQYEKAVSLGVVSKPFGLAGLRIGWAATKDKGLLEKMAAFKDYTSICNSAPSEFLAALALRQRKKILKRNLDIFQQNRKTLAGFFNRFQHLFSWVPPEGAPVAFPRLLKGSSSSFCKKMRENEVLLIPSELFDYEDKHFRIGLGRKNMPECLKKMEEQLE